MESDERVQKILKWRESFSLLPDDHFFELIRMYLGSVKTPFNKQKLVERLASFLRQDETKKTLISLLSENDVKILCAIFFLKQATYEKLALFFEDEYSFPNLYERLLNLEERLLIFRYFDKTTKKTFIQINPMLETELKPFLSVNFIIAQPKILNADSTNQSSPITPEFLVAVFSYIEKNPALKKNDGEMRKRAMNEAEKIFPKKSKTLFYLVSAFINLNLIFEIDGNFFLNENRIKNFCELDFLHQVLYLCVSSAENLSRNELLRQSEILLYCAKKIPPIGYSKKSLIQQARIFASDDCNFCENFFSKPENFQNDFTNSNFQKSEKKSQNEIGEIVKNLLDCAMHFGILEKIGNDENGDPVFKTGRVFELNHSDDARVLSVDAGLTATLFPGLSLKSLFPLTRAMNFLKIDTAAIFEITRKSAMAAFDKGFFAKDIFSILKKHSLYDLPESLKISLEEWENSYTSAAIYKGYVLCVDEQKIPCEKNPAIATKIKKKLAPGIYLLSVKNDSEANNLIEESGFDFIGEIKSEKKLPESAPFLSVNFNALIQKIENENEKDFLDLENFPPEIPTTKEQYKKSRDKILEDLQSKLKKIPLLAEQREEFFSRIKRKIIISQEQFRPDSVRLEKAEAAGIDYHGKILLVERAVSSKSLLEIEYEEKNSNGKLTVKTIVATPIAVQKLANDAKVTLWQEPFNREVTLLIGRAKRIKRIRGNLDFLD